jgi:transcriptional regulator
MGKKKSKQIGTQGLYKIIDMRTAGWSLEQIARQMGLTRQGVKYLIDKFKTKAEEVKRINKK